MCTPQNNFSFLCFNICRVFIAVGTTGKLSKRQPRNHEHRELKSLRRMNGHDLYARCLMSTALDFIALPQAEGRDEQQGAQFFD